MLCRACCSKGINKTPWDTLHREDEALVLGLIGATGVVWELMEGWPWHMALCLWRRRYGSSLCIAQGLGVTVVCDVHAQYSLDSPKPEGCGMVKAKPQILSCLTVTRIYLKNIFECLVKHHYVVCSNWKFVINTVMLARLADGGVGNIVFVLQVNSFCKLWEEF